MSGLEFFAWKITRRGSKFEKRMVIWPTRRWLYNGSELGWFLAFSRLLVIDTLHHIAVNNCWLFSRNFGFCLSAVTLASCSRCTYCLDALLYCSLCLSVQAQEYLGCNCCRQVHGCFYGTITFLCWQRNRSQKLRYTHICMLYS